MAANRPAGLLKAGDVLGRWERGKRVPAAVLPVKQTGRQAKVFNVVLEGTEAYVTKDFLSRSKPPPLPLPVP